MARLTERQTLGRVLEMLLGIGHPEVRARLAERGFRAADENEGWRRLREAVRGYYAGATLKEAPADALPALDTWENRWLPLARAALARSHPAVGRKLFAKLSQRKGRSVLRSVSLFVERVAALGKSRAAAEREAGKLLERRGLGRDTIDEARSLLARAKPVSGSGRKGPSISTRERDAALAALWAWYLDWSATARTVIAEPRLLRVLGFGR